jgi:translocation and assembly module TamA
VEIRWRANLRDRIVLRVVARAALATALLAVTPEPATARAESPAARLDIRIQGVDAALEEAVRSSLTLQQYRDRSVSSAQLTRLVSVGEKEIQATLEAWGYYDGRIESRTESRDDGGYRAIFQITPGDPVRVVAREVSVSGEAGSTPAVASVIENFQPRTGERFDHAQYEASKTAVVNALADHGFLGARLETHRVEVRTRDHSARIRLEWEGGPRYRFGPTTFTGGQFSPEFLDRFLAWNEGDEYSSADVLDMQRRLVNADYFGTVTVQPHIEKAVDLAVPVTVELTPAKRNIYSAAFYASTDRGAGVELGAQRRWLNDRGHKGRADLDIAQRLQAIELSYRIPLPGSQQRVLGIAGTYRDETTESSVSQTQKLVTNVSRKWGGYTFLYGLQFLSGDFEIGSETGYSSLTFLEGALTRAKSDQPAFAQRGYSYTVSARFTPFEQLTDTRFASLSLEGKWLHAFGPDTRLIVRSELGKMAVDDFDQLPPELRFFSGGDRSIRGFGYEEVGSRNAAGDVIGGNHLLEASVEMERYFRKGLGSALFVDAGDAFLGSDFVLHVGVGAGIRWKSPVGVLRLDLAYPIESIDSNSWQIHFNIGPDF